LAVPNRPGQGGEIGRNPSKEKKSTKKKSGPKKKSDHNGTQKGNISRHKTSE